jgi:hypothetical protein
MKDHHRAEFVAARLVSLWSEVEYMAAALRRRYIEAGGDEGAAKAAEKCARTVAFAVKHAKELSNALEE